LLKERDLNLLLEHAAPHILNIRSRVDLRSNGMNHTSPPESVSI